MKFKFDEIIEINGNRLTKKYIESLTKQQRLDLIEPVFNYFRNIHGFPFPDDDSDLKNQYNKLCNFQFDTNLDEIYNNSSMETEIYRYFCAKKFYACRESGKNKKSIIELWEDDKILKDMIFNRFGLCWLDESTNKKGEILPGVNESFNLSPNMMLRSFRSSHKGPVISIFKGTVAKAITMKYSNEGDTVFDYSCGWRSKNAWSNIKF